MTNNTQTTDRRQIAAAELVERHMSNRAARIITARQTAHGVTTWQIKGSEVEPHTVTIAPIETCSCRDHAKRRVECKHIKAVKLLTAPAAPVTPIPVEEWAPAGGWLSQRPRRRVEIEQEV